MEKKIIFLDIDGTLVLDNQEIPLSAIQACQEARKNGHKIYLCTGRSKPEIYDSIMEIGFDGVIGAGGGFVESNGDLLYHKQVSKESVIHLVDYFKENEFDFYLESNGGLFGSDHLKKRLEEMIYGEVRQHSEDGAEQESHPFIDALTFGEADLYRSDVNKACFIEHPTIPFTEIQKEFSNEFEIIQCTVPMFGKDSGELMVPGIHKAVAIEYLLTYLGVSVESTVAVGDGLNDREMFEFCNKSIAMGNAQDELKKLATFVTDDVDQDGLYKGFKKLHLI